MAAVKAYFAKGPPYYGSSLPCDSRLLGHSGAGGKFDWDRKQWYAPDNDTFEALVQTGKWRPDGVGAQAALAHLEMAREEQARAVEEAYLNRPRQAEPDSLSEAHVRQLLQVPTDKPEDLHTLLEEYQITTETVNASAEWESLGPRSGIPNARRLLRALKLREWLGITPEDIREQRLC